MTSNTNNPVLRPVHLELFPVLDNLDSVVDLGISQLPITTSTQLVGLLMTYHNTMVKLMKEQHEKTD
jgi:hypothetical protein